MTHKQTWMYVLIGGFVLGVLARSFFDFGIAFTVLLAGFAFIFVTLFGFSRNSKQFFAALLFLGIALGVVRFDIAALNTGDAYLDQRIGEEMVLTGVVIDEPDERETNTKLTVRLSEADGERADSKILVTTDRYPKFNYGDKLEIIGKLQKPEAFLGDDGRLFDYKAYLWKDDIFYITYFPEIERTGEREGNVVKQALFNLKESFLERVGRIVPEPQASLAGGLVVGAKQSLGESLLDDFRTTGIIHIVVLSGYNVTIVAKFLMGFFAFLPMAAMYVLGIGSIVLFAIMTGAGATIVRASIMAILVIIAHATGRTYAITHALILAGFLMILENPKILVFDSSFQLSFVATVGLIHLAPQIERYFKWLPERWHLRELATATIATQLFVLPMILYKMGQLSLVALPVNLLVLPVIPVTMLFGFLAGVFGFLSTFLSLPFAWIANALLSYELFIVELFAQIPFASVSVQLFPLWAAVGVYVGYGILLWNLYKKNSDARGSVAGIEGVKK